MKKFAFVFLFLAIIGNVFSSGPFTYQVAEVVPFDNTTSGLDSENVQSAIVELYNGNIDYDGLLSSFRNCGFQATSVGKAVEEINKMVLSQSRKPDVN